ncbi:MAG: TlpA family protein disulfide reductase [Deltaproteobacteria bacterium]|nr:MAG: TlpA family protein disulfide reductase [Deltaproteobacteria bacterium]
MAIVTASCSPDPQSPADIPTGLLGKQAPPITAEALAGNGPKTLEQAKGKVVIIDFWATYCDPCRHSFPRYQQLLDRHPGQLAVFAISIDNPESADADQVLSFAHQHPVDFPLFWDVEEITKTTYAPPAFPASYLLDRQGIIRHIHSGYGPTTINAIEKDVKKLLK